MANPTTSFAGFEPLTANYLYCPNQFFDVCLPHCSRGAVRVVAYLLRQTLGWLDQQGNPIRQEIEVTYAELMAKAGVSRAAIRPALDEAIAGRFIQCIKNGRPHQSGQPGLSATYKLRWDDSPQYVKSLDRFAGFYAGEGHRTPIPNAFFDQIVGRERLTVTKVVGTVLRHTIGYQNQFGGRRQSAPLSHRYIGKYARISQGKALSTAIQLAEQAGYIVCISTGNFAFDPTERQPSHYAVRWLSAANTTVNGSKLPAEPDRFKKTSSHSSESPAANRFKNPNKEKPVSNKTNKQSVVAKQDLIRILREAGFSRLVAQKLAEKRGVDEIQRQIEWLDARDPTENRLGMLRKAIEENWPMPASLQQKERQQALRKREQQRNHEQFLEEAAIAAAKKARAARKDRLLKEWSAATTQERARWIRETANAQTSAALATIIRRQPPNTATPLVHVLDWVAAKRRLPPVTTVGIVETAATESPQSSPQKRGLNHGPEPDV